MDEWINRKNGHHLKPVNDIYFVKVTKKKVKTFTFYSTS